jgi:hypothetical protein
MNDPINVIVLIGCLVGYVAADLLVSAGAASGNSLIVSLLPSAFGLAVGLVALRLRK